MLYQGFTTQHRLIGRFAAWAVCFLEIVSGVLSLAGLIGVPLENMQVRLIGVLGYVGVAPVVFLLLGMVFGHTYNQD